MRSRTERLAAGVLLAAVLVAGFRHELGWARGGGATAGGEGATATARAVELVNLVSTNSSLLEDSTRLVVRDRDALAAAWPGLALRLEPPVVSFEHGLVVIVATGRRPGGGYTISVDSAAREGDTLRVHVTTTSPGPGCVTSQALTAPAAAARVDDSAPVVSFVEATRVVEC